MAIKGVTVKIVFIWGFVDVIQNGCACMCDVNGYYCKLTLHFNESNENNKHETGYCVGLNVFTQKKYPILPVFPSVAWYLLVCLFSGWLAGRLWFWKL